MDPRRNGRRFVTRSRISDEDELALEVFLADYLESHGRIGDAFVLGTSREDSSHPETTIPKVLASWGENKPFARQDDDQARVPSRCPMS